MHRSGSYFRPELQQRSYVLANGYASNTSYAVTFWTHTRQARHLDVPHLAIAAPGLKRVFLTRATASMLPLRY